MVEYRLLSALPPGVRSALLVRARRRRFRRGEVVFHDGDPGDTLHLVAQGHFAVRVTTPRGDTAMLRVLRPGECFGELAVLNPAPRVGTVAALDSAATLTLHHEEFAQVRRANPVVDAALVEALTTEIRRLARALVDALYLPVEERVWRRLVDLIAIYSDGKGGTVSIPLTQEDLASLAGTTRSTANRVLHAAVVDGSLAIRRGRLDVLDPAAILAHAR